MKPRELTSLTKILNSIHQPLPLSQKESQRLLESLTTSFRKHLDEEHPGFGPEDKHGSKPSSHATAAAATSRAAPVTSLARRRPTDRHVHSILSNPLFSYDPASTTSATRAASLAKASRGGGGGGGGPGLQAERDPMDVFDEAVAKGMMTPLRAAGCLMAKRREIVQGGSLSIHDAMAAAGASRRVVRWLRASGLERDLSFLGHERLLDELVPFLMAEGHEEVVWSWLTAVMNTEKTDPALRQTQARQLLMRLTKYKSSGRPSLDDAYKCLLRAQQILPESWLLPSSSPAGGAERAPLLVSWHNLNWNSTVLAWKHPSKPSENLFDEFSAMGHRYLNPVSTANKLELAHLALHHPTTPSHELAMTVLDSPSTWNNWSNLQATRSNLVAGSTIRLRSLGLDMAQYFVQRGETEQAQTILRVLEERLGKYFTMPLHSLSGASPA